MRQGGTPTCPVPAQTTSSTPTVLFLPGEDAGPETAAAFARKVASLAAVIDQQAPDVLALQEVGPDDVLDRLRDRLTHQLPHAAVGDPDRRGIRVALLSTRPLANPTEIRALPDEIRPIQVRDPCGTTPTPPPTRLQPLTWGAGRSPRPSPSTAPR